jgi:hypothetical protein
LDQLIADTHGSRSRLLAYVKHCDPHSPLGMVTNQRLSKQLRGLDPFPRGPEWDYVVSIVQWCVPSLLHRTQRERIANGGVGATPDDIRRREPEDSEEAAAELAILAGYWCAARGVERPPRSYRGRTTRVPAVVDTDLSDVEALGSTTEQIALLKDKLDQARQEVRHAGREVHRWMKQNAVLDDELTVRTTERDFARVEARRLREQIQRHSAETAEIRALLKEEQDGIRRLRRQIRWLEAAVGDILASYATDETVQAAALAAVAFTVQRGLRAVRTSGSPPVDNGPDECVVIRMPI